jgi:lipopolysaccharide export system ATP-binding protein
MATLLDVRGLVKQYGRRRVVDGVDFWVNRGEIVGLLGPNGAGKTTSFRMTCGMIAPDAGQVMLDGMDVTRWPMYRRAREGMGYLAQESSVFRKLTVEQNILAVLELVGVGRKQRKQHTAELLEQFGLAHLRKNLAMTLSGGERRRLEIARCLATDPAILLLDEPFTGIDPKTIADIQDILRALREAGIALLLTDHNVKDTLAITDRAFLIREGSVLTHGTPSEVVRHPEARRVYFGERFDDANPWNSARPPRTRRPRRPSAGPD